MDMEVNIGRNKIL